VFVERQTIYRIKVVYYIDIDEIPWFPSWIKTIISLVKLPFLFHSRYISRHFVVDVIWRLPVWNVTIRCYLASCTLQFGSNLTKIIFQGKHFNYFIVVGWWRHAFWSDTHYSISLRYTRNIVQLSSFYIKFDSKHFFFINIINTITNWRVSLSKICQSWPNNVVTHSCAGIGENWMHFHDIV
jgi:hypothetical protein